MHKGILHKRISIEQPINGCLNNITWKRNEALVNKNTAATTKQSFTDNLSIISKCL